MSSNKAELIATQLLSGNINKKTWGSIGYNAIVEGVIEGGVTDTTAELQALVNKAISEGRRTIFLPHVTNGEYRVTALTNADQVDFVGDNCSFVGGYTGTITNMGGLAAHEADVVTDVGGVHGFTYEEGSWTPILSASTTPGTHTYSTQTGKYIKKNREVWASFNILISSKDASMSGDVFISGLPLAVAELVSSCALGRIYLDLDPTDVMITAIASDASIYFYAVRDIGLPAIQSNYIVSGSVIQGTVVYKTF